MKNNLGIIYMLLSAICFALMGILGKTVFNLGVSTLDLTILQNWFVIIAMLIYFAFKRFEPIKITAKDFKTLLLQGLFGSLPVFVFYYLCVEHINASIGCLLLFTNPVFIALYFVIFEKQKIGWAKMSAIGIALLGSCLVLNILPGNIGQIDLLGVLFGVLSSLAYAFYNIYAEKKLGKYRPETILFYCSIVVMVVVSLINPAFYRFEILSNPRAVLYIAVLSVASGILPVIFLYKGIAYLGAQVASVVANLEIPVTLILSALILGERLVPIQILGSIMTIVAVLILTTFQKVVSNPL